MLFQREYETTPLFVVVSKEWDDLGVDDNETGDVCWP